MLALRLISALVGLLSLWALWFFTGLQGLVVLCALVSLIGSWEFCSMMETKKERGNWSVYGGEFCFLSSSGS